MKKTFFIVAFLLISTLSTVAMAAAAKITNEQFVARVDNKTILVTALINGKPFAGYKRASTVSYRYIDFKTGIIVATTRKPVKF